MAQKQEFYEELPLLEMASVKSPIIYRSELIVGAITVRFTKKFNWFNRLMMKLVFGLNIKNVKEV